MCIENKTEQVPDLEEFAVRYLTKGNTSGKKEWGGKLQVISIGFSTCGRSYGLEKYRHALLYDCPKMMVRYRCSKNLGWKGICTPSLSLMIPCKIPAPSRSLQHEGDMGWGVPYASVPGLFYHVAVKRCRSPIQKNETWGNVHQLYFGHIQALFCCFQFLFKGRRKQTVRLGKIYLCLIFH